MKNDVSRRGFFRNIAAAGATAIGLTAVLTACKGGEEAGGAAAPKPAAPKPAPKAATKPAAKPAAGGLDCSDTSKLTEAEKGLRTSLGYVDKSTMPEKNCANCQLYVQPTTAGGCGGCTGSKGGINPAGYCNSWVAKAG